MPDQGVKTTDLSMSGKPPGSSPSNRKEYILAWYGISELRDVGRGDCTKNPEKIAAVKEFPPPTFIRGVGQFLGMASYYRRFIPWFAKNTIPLYAY